MFAKNDLRAGDLAVLYVTTCSDIDSSFKHARKLVECRIVSRIRSFDDKRYDDRFIVCCAEDLREEPFKAGLYAYEALVNVNSPFLMTWEEFNEYSSDPELLSRWIDNVGSIISGVNVPAYLQNWQREVRKIMSRLGNMEYEDVMSDIMEDFIPGEMKVYRFQY